MALSTRSRQHLDATRARQAGLGRNMLWVLIIGLVLVVLGFLATYAVKAPSLSSAPSPHASGAVHNFNAPQPAAATRQNYQQGGPLAPQNQGAPGQPNRTKTTEP